MISKEEIYRSTSALLLVTLTVAVANLFGQRAMLYPVIAALVIGAWVVDKHVWCVSRRQMILLLTVCAAAGAMISLYSPFSQPVNMTLAFCIAAIALFLSRSSLMPAISTSLLPVMLHIGSWMYPATVFCLATIVVLVQKLMERIGWRHHVLHFQPFERSTIDLYKWCILAVIVGIFSFLSNDYHLPFLMLPPVVVCLSEMIYSNAGFKHRPFMTLLLMVAAITLGTLFQYLHIRFSLPQAVSAAICILLLLALFHLCGKYFAPAGALSIIPMLLPTEHLIAIPLQTTVGLILFQSLALLTNYLLSKRSVTK